MAITFHIGAFVLGLVLVGVAYFAYRRTTPEPGRRVRAGLVALRVTAFMLLVFLLMDPRYVYESTRSEPPRIVALVDRSQSMQLPVAGWDATGSPARFERARALVSDLERAAGTRGARFSAVYFSGDGIEVTSDTVTATGQGSDVRRALLDVQQAHEGENVAAIVVFSDGVETVQRLVNPPLPTLPVFTVGVGDTNAPEDVRIQDLDYNSIVRAPSRSNIRATVHYSGSTSRPVRVRLTEDGRTVFAKDTLLSAEVREVVQEIQLDFPEAGRRSFVLEARVDGSDVELANNRRDVIIEAEKAGVKILIVDLLPGWELHFLTDLLRSDQTFDFDIVATFGGRPGAPGAKVIPPERFSDRLQDYDALVLSSVTEAFLDDGATRAIKRFVREDGKGLLILPGPASVFERAAAWNRLQDILPVRGTPPPRFRLQFTSVRPGAQASTNPITAQLVPLLSQTEWQERTPLLGFYAPLMPKNDVEVLLETQDRRTPTFVYQGVGKGRVALLGAGPLWRWKFLSEGNPLYDEMVSRLLDVLSRGEASERFMLTSKKNVYDAGESPSFAAEIFNERMQPVTGVPVKLELVRVEPGGFEIPLRIVAMKREGSDNTRFKADLPPLPAGTYRVRGQAELSGRTLTSQPVDLTVSEVSVEYRRVAQDRDNLVAVARQTGGRYEGTGDMAALVDGIPMREEFLTANAELSLRTSVWTFVVLLVVLATEWFVRKRAGMI